MTLRRKFALYLFAVHLVFAATVVGLLWNDRLWLLAVELFLLLSFLGALRIFRGLFRPLELVTSGAELMRDGDFGTRLRPSGQPEMDLLIGVYNSMADRLRSERVRMQEQHYFLEEILSVSPSAIVILDFDGRISYANPAASSLLGAGVEGLRGAPLSSLPSPFGEELGALASGASAVVPLRGTRKIRCRRSQFIDRGHPRVFFLLEELTEELRRTEKAAYEKLIRMMSHEVNNSLGAANSLLHSCLGYAAQLREEDRDDFAQAIAVAIGRTEHLNAFMKSFADIVKLPLPRKRPAGLRPLLERLVTLLAPECARRGIDVAWEIGEEPGSVAMDEEQMEQVLLNILKNGIEAVGEGGGTLTLRIGREPRGPFVAVEDTGSGMSAETRRHLFTPFFSTKEHGQGIGLTLVQEILSHHQFEFSLENLEPRGARFTILFPNGPNGA